MFACLLAIILIRAGLAQERLEHRRFLSIFGLKSVPVLGSVDRRQGLGLSIQTVHPDPKFKINGTPAKFVLEGYANYSWPHVPVGKRSTTLVQFGVLALARYDFRTLRVNWFYEAGWGINLSNHTSVDLDTTLNSTPAMGLGFYTDTDKSRFFEIRSIHMSNAGTNKGNNGQNQLWFSYSFRF